MTRFDYRHTHAAPAPGGWLAERPQMPYLLPFFAFVALIAPQALGHFAGIDWTAIWKQYQPWLYAARTLVAALLLWYFWPCYTRIRWHKLSWGVLAGLFGTLLWIGTELGARRVGLGAPPDPASIYNPDQALGGGWGEVFYLCIRVAGPALVVPVMEELFFRDFLMRALIAGGRFQDVAVGAFTWTSLIGMSLLFGVNHGRMFVAGAAYGLLMGLLLIRTKSLGACIVAHGVTNWTLYLYVIYTGDWQFM